MRTFLLVVVLLNVIVLLADPPPEPKERVRVTEKIKLDFKKFERKVSPEAPATSESDADVIELDSFQVFADYRYFVFDSEKRILEEKPFTWKDGGTFSRHVGELVTTEWKVQYDPRNNVVKFLSFSF